MIVKCSIAIMQHWHVNHIASMWAVQMVLLLQVVVGLSAACKCNASENILFMRCEDVTMQRAGVWWCVCTFWHCAAVLYCMVGVLFTESGLVH